MRNFCTALLLVLILVSCEKVEIVDGTPDRPILVSTRSIINPSVNEITFQGEITQSNSEEIIEYGFILYDVLPNPQTPQIIPVAKKNSDTGTFQTTYRSENPFNIDYIYSYCAYVKTKKALYKGEKVEFAVDLLKIDNESQRLVLPGESITINGDFTQISDKYFVTQGYQLTDTISFNLAKDKKSITVKIPQTKLAAGQEIALNLRWESKVKGKYLNRLLTKIKVLAKLNIPVKNQYYLGETIPFSGLGLTEEYNADLKLFIGAHEYALTKTFSLTNIAELKGKNFTWGYTNGRDTVQFSENLKILSPPTDIFKISNPVIHPKSLVYLEGTELPKYFGYQKIKVKIGEKEWQSDINQDIIFISEIDLPVGEYPIILENNQISITLPNKLIINKFKFTGFNPSQAYAGENIYATGSFGSAETYIINIEGQQEFYSTEIIDNKLKFAIPVVKAGKYKIKISYTTLRGEYISDNSVHEIQILPPSIETVSKNIVIPGEEIIIKGKGFKGINQIKIGNTEIFGQVNNGNNGNEIRFIVPSYVPAGSFKISVGNGFDVAYSNSSIEIK